MTRKILTDYADPGLYENRSRLDDSSSIGASENREADTISGNSNRK
jgi:hypothetical protein